jgi:dTDP-4-dehydrorhamnose reductase
LQFIASNYPAVQFVFCSSSDLDITQKEHCQAVFTQHQPKYCINAAAYTAVDKAESEPEKAHLINVVGVKNLAEVCQHNNCVLLHISTDFIFDGSANQPYTETAIPNPTGVYGQTKLDGEKAIQATFDTYFIIRTSWVYSQFGNNFMKTMLRLASERDRLSVVNDQIGTPTHAIDLAECLVMIIQNDCHPELVEGQQPTTDNYGIYNFSNEGQCSWFDFAKKIFEIHKIKIDLQPIPTSSYPTPAKRPSFSVLDKSKIKSVFGIVIQDWEESLKRTK